MGFIPMKFCQANLARQQFNIGGPFNFAPAPSAVKLSQSLEFSNTVRYCDVLNNCNRRNNSAKLNHSIAEFIATSTAHIIGDSSLRHISKPKIDRLSDADPQTDDSAEKFDRFQMMLRN